jgi:alanyl-tRNA synthetase
MHSLFHQTAPELSFLCISPGDNKVTVFCQCTAAAQQAGLTANTWVSTVLATAGGRGGGKPGSAQGSVAVPEGTSADSLMEKLVRAAEEVSANCGKY